MRHLCFEAAHQVKSLKKMLLLRYLNLKIYNQILAIFVLFLNIIRETSSKTFSYFGASANVNDAKLSLHNLVNLVTNAA